MVQATDSQVSVAVLTVVAELRLFLKTMAVPISAGPGSGKDKPTNGMLRADGGRVAYSSLRGLRQFFRA